ncbi:JmjC domain containing protein [Parasponia andersonii]|uniref:JmjC domain containing protein n=1 Tax=Parasponia andersonii TaxID=3476 RepID=A0A2P5AMC8_PARAD|nr:JmjC domain containing protein [Parasponia andersonii]
MFFRNFMKCGQGGLFSISHFKIEDLAESIFRLSLRGGDVLYIPGGFFHEAYTETGSMSAGYSLHLTLGIEVEPPFDV